MVIRSPDNQRNKLIFQSLGSCLDMGYKMEARQTTETVSSHKQPLLHVGSTVSCNLGSQCTPKFSVVLLRREISIPGVDKKKGSHKQLVLRNFVHCVWYSFSYSLNKPLTAEPVLSVGIRCHLVKLEEFVKNFTMHV